MIKQICVEMAKTNDEIKIEEKTKLDSWQRFRLEGKDFMLLRTFTEGRRERKTQ